MSPRAQKLLFGLMSRRLLVIAAVLALCPACSRQPDVAVELVSNELGVFWAISVHNVGSSEIEIQGVRVNGSLDVDKYMIGFLQDVGRFPVKLPAGQNIMVLNPVPWGDPTETVDVRADGMEAKFAFEE